MWKRKEKKEEIEEKKEESLLEELCGDDAELYNFLGNYLFLDPLSAISPNSLDALIEEGGKTGDFRPAVDKAIFEGAQNPGKKEKYIKIIQSLALKTIHATEKDIEKVKKEGLTDRVTYLTKRIELQKLMNEKTQDIINVASKFYTERLLVLGETLRRDERREEREKAEAEEWRKGKLEKDAREARKTEEKKMGREERKEAKERNKREEMMAEERKEGKGGRQEAVEEEERRIAKLEEAAREARKKERGN
ncbi:MAG: hypothetical protein PHG35_08510 [Dehalococcoidales bacterium]|nr:hypothetical protein [Dehalococcoidales bacterium]